MKTRTYKALLVFLILMQLGTVAGIAISLRKPQSSEMAQLLQLDEDLLAYHVTLGDYELEVAAANEIDTHDYDVVRSRLDADVNQLERTNEGHPERLEILRRQHEMFQGMDQVVEVLKDASNERSGGNRFSILITMLKGMRKLDKIAHQVHEDVGQLIATMPQRENEVPVTLLVALLLTGLSVPVTGLLLVKGTKAISY